MVRGSRSAEPRNDVRLIWVSPRRTAEIADAVAGNTVRSHLLHHLLASVKLPLDEFSQSHLVAMEIPPKMPSGFEHSLLRTVSRVMTAGPHVAIMVLPQSQTALWVHLWDRLDHAPFKFVKACTCELGNTVPGLHLTVLIGTTCGNLGDVGTCAHVPTTGCLRRSLVDSLGGLLRLLLAAVHTPGLADAEDLGATRTAYHRPAALAREPGSQQAPDSLSNEHYPLSKEQTTGKQRSGLASGSCSAEAEHMTTTQAFPTDSKEKERNRRNRLKAEGVEIKVKKKKFVVEDHYDDCG